MSIMIKPETVPLTEDEGVFRVKGTRVTLDTLIAAFNSGYTPEEIVLNYDTLSLADVYSVIGYYLRHKVEVDAYLKKRQQEAQETRQLIEAHQNHANLRERLLARKQNNTNLN